VICSLVVLIPVYHTAWCYIPEHYNLKITCVINPNLILYQKLTEEVDKKFQKSQHQKCIFDLRSQQGIETKNLPRYIKLSDKINICKWSREGTDFITNFSTGHKGIHANFLEINSSETNGYEIKMLLVH